jgi:hypothetical protein
VKTEEMNPSGDATANRLPAVSVLLMRRPRKIPM